MTPASHASVRLNPLGEVAGRCQLSNDTRPTLRLPLQQHFHGTALCDLDEPEESESIRTQHETIVDRSTDGGVSLDSVPVRDDSRQLHAEYGGKTVRVFPRRQGQHWIVYQRPGQLPAGQNKDRQSVQSCLLNAYSPTLIPTIRSLRLVLMKNP